MAAFIVIFLALIVIGAILSLWIGAMLRFLPVLGAANRLGGLALGLAIGVRVAVRDIDRRAKIHRRCGRGHS